MIGVTAAASAGVYLRRGFISPSLAMPVMLGVLGGSLIGARLLIGARVRLLRLVFALAILALGVEMIVAGLPLLVSVDRTGAGATATGKEAAKEGRGRTHAGATAKSSWR